ncbi:unnamed protein product [Didymodactylos carnosus]|uniref:Non-ribosomal peptide synthetase n=1 Tax=Didymodactylos carnosus TaxID=1234261 RepID=A0A8S2DPJ1_9BILA|nr:unnamed protein product [Didymodactylos carnosus]CAF3717528.1 unnamed protein product [Didymodactylos carnosus]
MNVDGRYKQELMSVIGMFVNTIPLRCQLDPHWSFHQLVDHVCEIMSKSLEYSYFPLQSILAQQPNATKATFLDTSFEFLSNENENVMNEVMIGNSELHIIPLSIKISKDEIMSKFDFSLTIQHDVNTGHLSCTINASLDLFDIKTIETIAHRFQSMLEQLFICSIDDDNDQMMKPIYELSLLLSNEKQFIQSMTNTQISFPSVKCIHHEFIDQVMKYPQKVAVELDEQSLTYSELFYYVQTVALNLLNKHEIVPGEIICQCVERNLSMVIGIMAIEMIGGVYCSLSPRDPQHRLYVLLEQTQYRLLLLHPLTQSKFNDDIIWTDTQWAFFARAGGL